MKYTYLLNNEEDDVFYKVKCSLKEYKAASNKALTEDYGVDLRATFCGQLAFKVMNAKDIDENDNVKEVTLDEYLALWHDVLLENAEDVKKLELSK